MPVPRAYEALLSPGSRAAKETSTAAKVKRLVKLDPKTDLQVRQLPPSTAAEARPRWMGRGRGTIVVDAGKRQTDASLAGTIRHERAHLAPKRNSARLAERMTRPSSAGREEARASYLAGSPRKYQNPHDPRSADGKAFQAGFNEVTRKMRAARTKDQVNKRLSAFGVVW